MDQKDGMIIKHVTYTYNSRAIGCTVCSVTVKLIGYFARISLCVLHTSWWQQSTCIIKTMTRQLWWEHKAWELGLCYYSPRDEAKGWLPSYLPAERDLKYGWIFPQKQILQVPLHLTVHSVDCITYRCVM